MKSEAKLVCPLCGERGILLNWLGEIVSHIRPCTGMRCQATGMAWRDDWGQHETAAAIVEESKRLAGKEDRGKQDAD
jgi:hypothetical protein